MKHPSAWTVQGQAITPLGPLLLVATEQGLAGAWFEQQAHHPGTLELPREPRLPLFERTAQALAAYFSQPGSYRFNLPLDPQGTAFQQAVWRQLQAIGPGKLGHYGQIAWALGNPSASRAVGAAVGRNPISIILPCHRVVGRDGAFTGYAGGLHRKQALLQAEAGQAPLLAPLDAEPAPLGR